MTKNRYTLNTKQLEYILAETIFSPTSSTNYRQAAEKVGMDHTLLSPKRLATINRDNFLNIVQYIHDTFNISYKILMTRLIILKEEPLEAEDTIPKGEDDE